jgi:outer membrane protein
MKTIFTSLIIIIVLGTSMFFLLKNNNSEEKTEVKSENESIMVAPKMQVKDESIVYVNSDSLMENYAMYKAVKKELEQEKASAENTLKAMYSKFESQVNDLREKAASMTEEESMSKQQELAYQQQKLSDYENELSQKISMNQMKKLESVHTEIEKYIDANYSQSKYSYIIGKSSGGGVLYAKSSLNITKEVLEGLNNSYLAQTKK